MLPSRVRISVLKSLTPAVQNSLSKIHPEAAVLAAIQGTRIAVASAGGQVIGFAISSPVQAHVHSSWKNQGIEQALLDAL